MAGEAGKEPKKTGELDSFYFRGLLIVLIVVAAVLIGVKALNQQPEPFTQIYLEQEFIVERASVGEGIQVKFFIENFEGRAVEYSYKISPEGGEKIEGSVSLEQGEKRGIVEEVSFQRAYPEKQKVLFEVFKEGRVEPYTLWFWVEVD